MNQANFSSNLAFYRKKRGFTQERLAQALSVTPQAVSKWEKGSYPDGDLLPKLAETLHISLDVLFGLKPEEDDINLVHLMMEEIHQLPEEARSSRIIELFYHMLYTYHDNLQMEYVKFPSQLPKETFAHLRSDCALAIERLNADMQYACFLKIPKEGLGSYVKSTPRMLELFRLLSDETALRIIFFAEALPRNFVLTTECISKKLHIPIDTVSAVVEECNRMGLLWELTADISGSPIPVYCYVHNIPLTMILTLATSVTNFIINREPDIDIWDKPPFRGETASQNAE